MVCASEGDTSTTQHKAMTDTELTLDQLQAVSGGWRGGAGEIMAEIRGRRSVADIPRQFRLRVRSMSGPGGLSSLRAPRIALSFSEFFAQSGGVQF